MSPFLITKILMGTLGCVPAYERFFQDGVAKHKVTTQEYSPKSVLKLVVFYEAHNDRLEEARRGMQTEDRRCQWVVAMSSLNASVGVR